MIRPEEIKPRLLVFLACSALLALPAAAGAQTVDERIQKGRRLLGEGQLEQALAELQQAIDESPDSAPALYFAGMALGRLSRFDESLDYLVRASEADPGNGSVHQAATIAALRGGRSEAAWDQAIMAAQSGVDMSLIFPQIESVAPAPDDFEARMAVPRVLVVPLDTSGLRTGDLNPGETEAGATVMSRAQANIPAIHHAFALGLMRSPRFAVVKQAAQADYVLVAQANSFDGETIDGYVLLVDPTSGEEQYTRRMKLSNITSLGAVRNDVAAQVQFLELWVERQR